MVTLPEPHGQSTMVGECVMEQSCADSGNQEAERENRSIRNGGPYRSRRDTPKNTPPSMRCSALSCLHLPKVHRFTNILTD